MGRNKKYHTDEEKKAANRADWKRWYNKNKDKHNTRQMEAYYEKRIKEMEEKLSNLRESD
jgi:hypothetical protein